MTYDNKISNKKKATPNWYRFIPASGYPNGTRLF